MTLKEMLRWRLIHRGKVAEYEDRITHLERCLSEPDYLKMNYDKARQELNLTAQHWSASMLVQGFADMLASHGARNYLVLDLVHPEMGPFSVTVQKKNGKSPAQDLHEAHERIGMLRQQLEFCHSVVTRQKKFYDDAILARMAKDIENTLEEMESDERKAIDDSENQDGE